MFSTPETADLPRSWRERALDRSVGDVRARQERRLERFVDAARALANATGSADFTVHDLVHEAELSRKSFYACFAGKDDLLCALLEEDSRIGASLLAPDLARCEDPVERVRTYVRGLVAFGTLPEARGYVAVLLREHRRLAEQRPIELRQAIAPLVVLLVDTLRAARAAGALRPRDLERDAEMIFGLTLDCIATSVFADRDAASSLEAAEYVWQFCRHGLARADTTDAPDRY